MNAKLSTTANLAVRAMRGVYAIPRALLTDVYSNDGLICFNSHPFMADPDFRRAYQRGVQAIGGDDWYQWHWRVHIGLWAASNASLLDGDFVECGVNYGFLSSAIMEYLDWNSTGKTFYLLDTFTGIDPAYITAAERDSGALRDSARRLQHGAYANGVDAIRANFSQWENHRIVVGPVPDTLDQVDTRSVAFLHIDMNCVPPETAALRHFWPLLTPGAPVLLDDYANRGRDEQRTAMDALASQLGVHICALPTGQGLLIKPSATTVAAPHTARNSALDHTDTSATPET